MLVRTETPMQDLFSSVAETQESAELLLRNLISKNPKSNNLLLKEPNGSTPKSWNLYMPPHFNASLDLRFVWKQKIKGKTVVRKWKEWTQGSFFCFNEGAIIYDRDISGCVTWQDKLEVIDFFVVLGQSVPVSLRSSSINGIDPGHTFRHPGSVILKVYKPLNSVSVSKVLEKTITQDQFIQFAITGQL